MTNASDNQSIIRTLFVLLPVLRGRWRARTNEQKHDFGINKIMRLSFGSHLGRQEWAKFEWTSPLIGVPVWNRFKITILFSNIKRMNFEQWLHNVNYNDACYKCRPLLSSVPFRSGLYNSCDNIMIITHLYFAGGIFIHLNI